ncbi:MAG: hypothetical protein JWM32_1149 [Verrucomicrobia bacterium]|nr:hypothetical protein [Verrucomicrobiota bacterium]
MIPKITKLVRVLGFGAATLLSPAALIGATATAPASPAVLQAAIQTFAVTPTVGMPSGASRTAQNILQVYGDLKTTLVLFEYGDTRLCYVTSSFGIYEGAMNTAVRAAVAKELGFPVEQVVAASSHNHTVPLIDIRNPEAWGRPGDFPPKSESNPLGRDFMEKLCLTARGLRAKLAPVTIEWGVAREERVTYNRRGKRADGTSYFIREEDRVLLPRDYHGTIDPDAVVVVLRGADTKPVGAIAFFTGHPITGYNPEAMVSFGQWSQVACEKLSAHLGGVPVAFLQGCAGDVNSKYLLTGTVEQSRELGEFLGESYIAAANALHPSKRTDFVWTRAKVTIPQAPLPSLVDLKKDLAACDDFIRRGHQGDQNTLFCVGMNFPKALTPLYRAALIEMVRPWYVWAVDARETGLADKLPRGLPIEIVVARFGDVGYVGMPFEPFVKIGLRIKRETPLPCVLPSGYTDGSYGYIPDSTACNDREYMGGFFRYLPQRLPYTAPGGDAVGDVAIPILKRFAATEK